MQRPRPRAAPSKKGRPATLYRASSSCRPNWTEGIPAFELIHRTGLAPSKAEARRLIKGGGARLNDAPIADEMQLVTSADLSSEKAIKLSVGKKRHAIIQAG